MMHLRKSFKEIKTVLTFAAFVSLVSVPNTGFAADDSSDLNVGLVDMNVIEGGSTMISDLSDKIESEQSKFQQDLSEKSKDIQKRARELEAKRGMLQATALEEKRKALESEIVALQNEAQLNSANLQQARKMSLDEVNEVIRDAVAKIASKKKLIAVVPDQMLLFVDKSRFTDITSELLKDVNANPKNINIKKYLSGGQKSSQSKSTSKKKK